MNAKQLKWVVIGLLVAVALWAGSEALTKRPDDRQTARVLPEDVAGIDRMVITTAEDTVILARTGTKWKVNGYDVAVAQMVLLFEALSDSSESEVVATNPAVHERMGVAEEGQRLTFFRDLDTAAVVIFGNQGRDGSSRYARLEGSDAVYRYNGPLTDVLANGVDDWRDDIIADVMPEEVAAVVVRGVAIPYILTRQTDGGWAIGEEVADSATAERLLARYRPLQATGFAAATQLDSIDLVRPDRQVLLLGATGDTLAAMLFDSTDAGYWVRRVAGETVYQLPHQRVDQLMPDVSDFRPTGR